MRSVLSVVAVCLLTVLVTVAAEKVNENSASLGPGTKPLALDKEKPLAAETPIKNEVPDEKLSDKKQVEDSVKDEKVEVKNKINDQKESEKVSEEKDVVKKEESEPKPVKETETKEEPQPVKETETKAEPQPVKETETKAEPQPVKETETKEEPKPEDVNRKEEVEKPIVENAEPSKDQNEKPIKEEMQNVQRIQEPSSDKEEMKKVMYNGAKVLRVVIQNKEQKKMIRQMENKGEISTWSGNGTAVDILVKQDKVFDILDSKKMIYDVIIKDLQKAIEEENPPIPEDEWSVLEGRKVEPSSWWIGDEFLSPYRSWWPNDVTRIFERIDYDDNGFNGFRRTKRKKKKKKKRRGHRMTWQMYHRMSDIHGYVDYLTATYPDMCSQETIGYSIEGRPLKVLKISSGEPNAKAMWVDSGIHAREWITPATSTYIISQMVENGDGTHGVDWYFLPLVNPDGYEHSHTTDRLWRKNRANSHKGPCAGTDLNRNFGYRWGGQGSSQQPCRETYAGSGPFSEPETNAINKFVLSKSKDLGAYVSLHSYGQYILYPWGYDRKVPPDYSDLHRVGRAMAQSMRSSGGQIYRVGSAAATLYPASGGSDDWAKGVAKIKYTYTIELRDTGRHGFVLPAQYIQPTAKEAYAALKTLAAEVKEL